MIFGERFALLERSHAGLTAKSQIVPLMAALEAGLYELF